MIKTTELRQIKDILKALIMSSALENFKKMHKHCPIPKMQGGGEGGKLWTVSLRSYYAKKNQAWTNHCSVICKAIPFNFFTDFGNVNPDQKKMIAIRHSVNLGAAAFLARVSFRQPAKISVSPRSSPLGTFRAERRLRLSDRNSILMTEINVYILNTVVKGFQI